jgi:hypothetical protein
MKSMAFSWPSLIAIFDDSLCSSAEYIFLVRRDEERRGWEKRKSVENMHTVARL